MPHCQALAGHQLSCARDCAWSVKNHDQQQWKAMLSTKKNKKKQVFHYSMNMTYREDVCCSMIG